ncbi:MAG TPA: response regulator transcription factor [Thermomicrobiales bacterium]|jgi:DNA-binding NarL/FixJ family response regulator
MAGEGQGNESIRVLIADDQRLMRDGLRALLELQDGIVIVGEAGNGVEALDQSAELAPDVVLMDVRMPQMTGVEATRTLRERGARPRILVLTTFDDDQYVFDALKAGASGYVLKDLPAADLAAAIRTVHGGRVHLDPSVASKVVAELARLQAQPAAAPHSAPSNAGASMVPFAEELTPREREVLRLLATGASNREIGAQLFISEGTVKNHISNILGRLGLRDRTQAAIYAKEHGLA